MKIVGAAALQGVIFKVTRVVVDRYGAVGWRYLTGLWPGEKRPGLPTSREPPDDETALPVVGERVLERPEVAAEQMIDRSRA